MFKGSVYFTRTFKYETTVCQMSTARARDETKTTMLKTRNTGVFLGGINRIFRYLPFHTFLIQIGSQLANSRPKRPKTR